MRLSQADFCIILTDLRICRVRLRWFLQTKEKKTTQDDEEEEEDIDAAFDKEKAVLKEKKKEGRRFQVVESGANNCIFIKTTVQVGDNNDLCNYLIKFLDKRQIREMKMF